MLLDRTSRRRGNRVLEQVQVYVRGTSAVVLLLLLLLLLLSVVRVRRGTSAAVGVGVVAAAVRTVLAAAVPFCVVGRVVLAQLLVDAVAVIVAMRSCS
jgi:predicted anti-sigma-YlaC factor YlaD